MAKTNERGAVPGPPQPERRKLLLDDQFFEDFDHWLATDARTARRLVRIVRETLQNPFEGIGKPERMKYQYRGCWSRRLTDEHRIVYLVTSDAVNFLSAKAHYE